MPALSFRRVLVGAAVALAVVAPLLAPSSAEARWVRRGWGWRPGPAYVAAPQTYYLPAPYSPARLRSPVWVTPHLNRYGGWVPGYRR